MMDPVLQSLALGLIGLSVTAAQSAAHRQKPG